MDKEIKKRGGGKEKGEGGGGEEKTEMNQSIWKLP